MKDKRRSTWASSSIFIGFILYVLIVIFMTNIISRDRLATQIADGTHEVVWSVNEFGTREVRIMEVGDEN